MEASDGVGKVERLPMLLSGIGGTKLLGVSAVRHKSSSFAGSLIADASDELIKIWGCPIVWQGWCLTRPVQTLELKLWLV